MKHSAFDWLAAWVLALAMIAAIGLVGSLARAPVMDHIDVSRSGALLVNPSDSRMIVDRDEPLVDPADAEMGGGSDLPEDVLAARPAC